MFIFHTCHAWLKIASLITLSAGTSQRALAHNDNSQESLFETLFCYIHSLKLQPIQDIFLVEDQTLAHAPGFFIEHADQSCRKDVIVVD